jgi:hypothetical protein
MSSSDFLISKNLRMIQEFDLQFLFSRRSSQRPREMCRVDALHTIVVVDMAIRYERPRSRSPDLYDSRRKGGTANHTATRGVGDLSGSNDCPLAKRKLT